MQSIEIDPCTKVYFLVFKSSTLLTTIAMHEMITTIATVRAMNIDIPNSFNDFSTMTCPVWGHTCSPVYEPSGCKFYRRGSREAVTVDGS
jgi:hypothetical protein